MGQKPHPRPKESEVGAAWLQPFRQTAAQTQRQPTLVVLLFAAEWYQIPDTLFSLKYHTIINHREP